MIYQKLVRDKIPEIISKTGAYVATHIADDIEFKHKLLDKILEEAKEIHESNGSFAEIADLVQVLDALWHILSIEEQAELLAAMQKKLTERGGFEKRIILEETF